MNHTQLEDFSDVMGMIGRIVTKGEDFDSGTDFMQVRLDRVLISVDMDADIKGICSVSVDHDDDAIGLRFVDFEYTNMSVEDIILEVVDFIEDNV